MNVQKTTDWTDWLMMHKRSVTITCACLLMVIIGSVWTMQSRNTRRIKDFERADILAEELSKGDNESQEQTHAQALTELQELDDRYTILQPRFDGLIGEELLLQNKGKISDPYCKRTIERLRSLGLELFADFSEVSRLSGLGQYPEALLAAQHLQKRLSTVSDSARENYYALKAFLLLHIATFNQKLGKHDASLQTLLQLKEHLGLTPREVPLTFREKELAGECIALLQDEQHSLLEYMEEAPKKVGF